MKIPFFADAQRRSSVSRRSLVLGGALLLSGAPLAMMLPGCGGGSDFSPGNTNPFFRPDDGGGINVDGLITLPSGQEAELRVIFPPRNSRQVAGTLTIPDPKDDDDDDEDEKEEGEDAVKSAQLFPTPTQTATPAPTPDGDRVLLAPGTYVLTGRREQFADFALSSIINIELDLDKNPLTPNIEYKLPMQISGVIVEAELSDPKNPLFYEVTQGSYSVTFGTSTKSGSILPPVDEDATPTPTPSPTTEVTATPTP